jgi:glycosyltransferase involved in cell wall biosynthesis|tara:strand:- start:302 stop:1483 length:1182 start_codon:yes stop_codon:yes gene_type:complete
MLTILTLKMLLMIVYLAHWDWILTQSRKDIVSNINDSKFMAICPFDQNEIELGNYYKETIDWKLNRNKIFDFWGIKNLRNIIKDLNSDDIVHVFTLKSGLLFAFANLFRNNKTKNILTITGLGYLFSDNFKAKILKILLGFFIKRLVNKNFDFLMYQNGEDQKTFNNYSKYNGESFIIPTSGITVKELELKKEYRNSNLKVIMATRLINDKGIFEYLELANLMKDSDFEFYLAGDLDNGNPDSLSESQLNEIKNSNFINYLGHIDIKKELQNFDINIVMSKYEGSSRILLESLYVGLICLSNNIPGTSEVSSKFRNSFFIDENNIEEFRRSLDEIINHDAFSDNTQNILFGEDAKYNRELIDENYTSVKIAAAYNKIYRYLRKEIESYKSEFI